MKTYKLFFLITSIFLLINAHFMDCCDYCQVFDYQCGNKRMIIILIGLLLLIPVIFFKKKEVKS